MKLTFEQEKETKNTVRFQEQVKDGEQPVIGPLYIQKHALGANPPQTISLEIENFSESTLTPADSAV
jgi:hypothetical protein